MSCVNPRHDAETFLDWAQTLSRGSSFPWYQAGLTQDHLSRLLRVKNFPPVARQLMLHVRSSDERKLIRRNLSCSSVHKNLVEEEGGSTKDGVRLRSITSSLDDARREAAAEAKALKAIVEEEARVLEEERELKRQLMMVDAAIEAQDSQRDLMASWSSAVDQVAPRELSPPSTPGQEAIKQEAAENDLEEILGALKVLKSQQLDCKGRDFHQEKLAAWRGVERVLERHCAQVLMKGLVAISAKEGAALTKATQQIDLTKDAKALRLRFSSKGALVDDADPRGLLHTMDSMLVQMSGRHVNAHLNNHRKRQEAKAVAQLLKNNKDCAHSTLKELEYGNPSATPQDLFLSLFDATVRVAGLKASLETAASLGRDLEARATQALKAKEEVTAKYEKIHRFEDHVTRGATELKTLALGLSMSKAALEEENSEVAALVEEALARISLPTPYVKDSLTEELDAALQSQIHSQRLNSVPCSVVTSGSCLDLESVSDAVPFLAAWDKVLDALRQKKLRVCQEETEVSAMTQVLDVMLRALETKDISTQRLKDLQASVDCHDRAIEDQVLPLLAKGEEMHAIMKLNLEQLKETIEEWWTQPGPFVKELLKQPAA